jgi:hypothetical protein
MDLRRTKTKKLARKMRPFLPFVLGVIFVIVAVGIESEEDPALFVLQMVLGPRKLFVKII